MVVKKYAMSCKICSKKYVGSEVSSTCSSECYSKYLEHKQLSKYENKATSSKKLYKNKSKRSKNKKKNKLARLNKLLQEKNKYIRSLKKIQNDKRIKYNVKSFYDSDQWRQLRYKALKYYGRKCMLCNTTEGEMHVDHIKPRSKYPELELEFSNLQILCKDCNFGKSNIFEDDFRSLQDT